jgi:signal peptidase I
MTEEDTRTSHDEGAEETTTAATKRKRGILLFLRDLLIIFVVAVLVSFLIKTFLIRSFFIPSQSMEHTLEVDDRIIVNELVPDLVALEHGDVVVFQDPGGWLPATPEIEQPPLVAAVDWFLALVGLSAPDSNDHLVKRLIGMPGDHVVCCNALGQMSVNGVPLDEPYVVLPPGEQKVSRDDFDVTVPDDSLWVMGDNRYNSKDSRYNRETPREGFVPVENIVGKAFVVSWPVSNWEWLGNYPEVFAGVDEAND